MSKRIQAGLFGFGVVGEGIYNVLAQKPNLGVDVAQIVIKHIDKERTAPKSLFSTTAETILENDAIELVIELIDDADAAFDIVIKAMHKGKNVISANKKMIAEHHKILIDTARANNVSFLYEAAVCGSIPLIRNLEEYFDTDLVTSVSGIINGSTNYILTQMSQTASSYNDALLKAQSLGFAESNPSLDVEGIDAKNKLKIIALHAFGKLVNDEHVIVKGIHTITDFDIKFAKEKGLVVKLVATCSVDSTGDLKEVSVLPTFLPKQHALRLTNNEFNGVLIGGQLSDEQFFYGKGAGRYPTSSAVLSDISAFKYGYKYEYKKGIRTHTPNQNADIVKKVYISYDPEINFSLPQDTEFISKFKSSQRNYLIAQVSTATLQQLVKNNTLSVITF